MTAGPVTGPSECAGLSGDHFDEDVVVDPDGLLLLEALGAL